MASFFRKLYRFIVPADIGLRQRRLELIVWSFLLSLSFYSSYFGFLAWIALVRPIEIISSLRGRDAFNAAYFYSFLLSLFCIYWIAMVTPPGMVSAVLIVASYYAVGWMVFLRVYHFRQNLGLMLLPFIWVAVEYSRALSEFAFPWFDLGYSQSYYLYILQLVSITSVHGLSFLIVLVNVLLFQIRRKSVSPEKKITAVLSSAAIVLMLVAYGWITVPKYPESGDYPVALMQGSVPPDIKWEPGNQEHSYGIYDSLAMSVADDSVQLIVWPETSAPCYLTHNSQGKRRVAEIARNSRSYHLVGTLAANVTDDQEKQFNSCFQVNPEGKFELRHDKVKLVPFAEHVPYQDNLSFLQRDFLKQYLTFIETYDVQWWSNFYPGDSLVIFDLPEAAYAVMICFESAFPEYVRSSIRRGAEFIVGITNDTWFGHSVGIHMHSRIFLTRAVENRVWGVRVANSGLTYIVDGYGRIRNDLKLDQVATLVGSVKRLEDYSVFTQVGDLIGLCSFLIVLSLLCIMFVLWLLRLFGFSS